MVDRIPRSRGSRCGVKVRRTSWPAARESSLFHLRGVPVPGRGVGLEVVVDLAVQQVQLGLAPRSGDAGGAVGDDALGLHQPGPEQGDQGHEHAGHVAAGIGHQPSAANLVPVELGQPVDRLGQQVRLGVGAVPLFIDRGVAQPEVGRQVNDLLPPARRKPGAVFMPVSWGTARKASFTWEAMAAASGGQNSRSTAPVRAGNTSATARPWNWRELTAARVSSG